MLILHKHSQGYGSLLGFAIQIGTDQKNISVTLQTHYLSSGNFWIENISEYKIICISSLPLITCAFEATEAKNTHMHTGTRMCLGVFLSIDIVLLVVCANDH